MERSRLDGKMEISADWETDVDCVLCTTDKIIFIKLVNLPGGMVSYKLTDDKYYLYAQDMYTFQLVGSPVYIKEINEELTTTTEAIQKDSNTPRPLHDRSSDHEYQRYIVIMPDERGGAPGNFIPTPQLDPIGLGRDTEIVTLERFLELYKNESNGYYENQYSDIYQVYENLEILSGESRR